MLGAGDYSLLLQVCRFCVIAFFCREQFFVSGCNIDLLPISLTAAVIYVLQCNAKDSTGDTCAECISIDIFHAGRNVYTAQLVAAAKCAAFDLFDAIGQYNRRNAGPCKSRFSDRFYGCRNAYLCNFCIAEGILTDRGDPLRDHDLPRQRGRTEGLIADPL